MSLNNGWSLKIFFSNSDGLKVAVSVYMSICFPLDSRPPPSVSYPFWTVNFTFILLDFKLLSPTHKAFR